MGTDRESLLWSLKNGDVELVKTAITSANVNNDIEGRRAVHYAADFGHTGIVAYLISVGADLNAKDVHGITPLLAAVWEGHTATVQLLLAKGADPTIGAPDGTKLIDCADNNDIKSLFANVKR